MEQEGAERELVKALKATESFTFLDSTPGSSLFRELIRDAKNNER